MQLSKNRKLARRLLTLEVGCDRAPAHGGASVMLGGEIVGTITSGEWGHRTGMNLAYAFVSPELAAPGCRFDIDILGDLIAATVIKPGPYDPDYNRIRGLNPV